MLRFVSGVDLCPRRGEHLPGEAQHTLLVVDALRGFEGAVASIEPEDLDGLVQFSGTLLIDLDRAWWTTLIVATLDDEQRGANLLQVGWVIQAPPSEHFLVAPGIQSSATRRTRKVSPAAK